MIDLEAIPTTYDEAVRLLAAWHADSDRADLQIFAFSDPAESVVRLIEVSDDFPRTGKVAPVTFGPSGEFPFRSSVALVTPGEWDDLLAGRLPLPAGWELARRERIWPHGGA